MFLRLNRFVMLGFCNIFFDPSSSRDLEHLVERYFISHIFERLSKAMGNSFYDYHFYIYSNPNFFDLPLSAQFDFPKKVLFYLSNEDNATPKHLSKYYHTIFKTYLTESESNNIHPFPLGYVGEKINHLILPINERKTSIFFSGNLNRNRISLIRELSRIKYSIPWNSDINEERTYRLWKFMSRVSPDYSHIHPQSYIRFTPQFMGGLSIQNYQYLINNSKIALCPTGFFVNQTYRHYEALRGGCVALSLELPKCPFLKDSPIIQVETWEKGLKLVKKILNDPDLLEEISKQGVTYYENNCSEAAAAKYIRQRLHNYTGVRKAISLSPG